MKTRTSLLLLLPIPILLAASSLVPPQVPASPTAAGDELGTRGSELRALALQELSSGHEVDGSGLFVSCLEDDLVVAGAPPARRTGTPGLLGVVHVSGSSDEAGGRTALAGGTYTLREAEGGLTVELVDEDGEVAATVPLDPPTDVSPLGVADPSRAWTRVYLAVVAALAPRA